MPGPDPDGLYIDEYDNGDFTIGCEIWEHTNRSHRIRRMLAVAANIRRGGWRCLHCREPIPLYRRADAYFCRERCRKAAARARRGGR